MTNPPTMQRSRGQLATSYAPHSLFTFEGGSGACMALSASGNRNAELRPITQRMIGEQIQEYFEAWADRAMRGQNLRHPVPPSLAVDNRVLSDQAVRVRLGDLVFQVPDVVGYVPFPLAFSCTRCGLHRECRRLDRVAEEAARFHQACPTGAAGCADDWQQIDVVLTHWSGEIEAISPSYRYWDSANGQARDIARCGSCESDRFFLRRPPGALAGWHFECVACRTVRQILQRDLRTLESTVPTRKKRSCCRPQVGAWIGKTMFICGHWSKCSRREARLGDLANAFDKRGLQGPLRTGARGQSIEGSAWQTQRMLTARHSEQDLPPAASG